MEIREHTGRGEDQIPPCPKVGAEFSRGGHGKIPKRRDRRGEGRWAKKGASA